LRADKQSQVGVWLSGRWFVSMLKHIANWLACIGFDCEIHIGIIGELCHNPNASIILQSIIEIIVILLERTLLIRF